MIIFWPYRRLRRALAVGGLAAAAFFCWLITVAVELPVSGQLLSVIDRGDPERRAVALMFNVDWGEEYVPRILRLLAQHQAKATFFVTGQWAEKFPGLVREMVAGGHEVENHGYGHIHVAGLGKQQVKHDLNKAGAVLRPLTGKTPSFYAPPYGETSKSVVEAAAEEGYQTVLWSIDTIDWRPDRQAGAIIGKVKNNLANGVLVLMHPTAVTVEALPAILTHLRTEGYLPLCLAEVVAPQKNEVNKVTR